MIFIAGHMPRAWMARTTRDETSEKRHHHIEASRSDEDVRDAARSAQPLLLCVGIALRNSTPNRKAAEKKVRYCVHPYISIPGAPVPKQSPRLTLRPAKTPAHAWFSSYQTPLPGWRLVSRPFCARTAAHSDACLLPVGFFPGFYRSPGIGVDRWLE